MFKNSLIFIALLSVVSSWHLSYTMEREPTKIHSVPSTETPVSKATVDLIKAIEEHNFYKAQQAIKEGADVNFHYHTSSSDFSKTEWTPLMKAVAHLAYVMITSQSRLNSLFWIQRAHTELEYRPSLRNLYNIVQLLLKTPGIDKAYSDSKLRTAHKICKHALTLLSAETLIPPYKTNTPEEWYTTTLKELSSQLPEYNVHEVADTSSTMKPLALEDTPPLFQRNGTFSKVPFDGKLPIVFDPNYDISAYGIEKLHPFDAKKYGKVWALLAQKLGFRIKDIHTPASISDEDVKLVHTPQYTEAIKDSTTLGILADMDSLGWLPNSFVQKVLLDPVKLATGGTVLAANLALKHGWAINISGGYHHAKSQELVRGFCIINDICIAAKKVLAAHPEYRILIVDLDAHQGNGHEEICKNEKNIAIFDIYNADTWPGDYPCQERINFNFPLQAKTKDARYLQLLTQELPKAIDSIKPDLIIYNAGTDVYEEDPLGMLSITREGIVQRDEFVFQEAMKRNIPILMVLSGGYHAQSYSIIAQSIENLWRKCLDPINREEGWYSRFNEEYIRFAHTLPTPAQVQNSQAQKKVKKQNRVYS